MGSLARLRAALLVAIVAALHLGPVPSGAAPAAPSTMFATGFDRGPLQSTVPGLTISGDPAATVRWQSAVSRTGTGAYHFVGGNVRADATIHNGGGFPLGDLEAWAGGAYRFLSFPNEGSSWLLVTVPTDGRSGADTKPVVSIDRNGRLTLSGGGSEGPVARSLPLQTNRWYYLMLHGRNGPAQRQELYVYDGRDGLLLERVDLTLDVTGDFRNPVTKWGFGTAENSTGLEYYLDDIYYSPGSANPGAVRVVTAVPTGTASSDGFRAVGADTPHQAVDEAPPDGDTSFAVSGGDDQPRELELLLGQQAIGAADGVHAVQTLVSGKGLDGRATLDAGIRAGGTNALISVPLDARYATRRVVHAADPRTRQPWSATALSQLTGVLRDDDGVSEDLRVSSAWWEIVLRQGGEAPSSPSPSPSPLPSPPPSPSPTPSPSPDPDPLPIPLPIPLPFVIPLPLPLPLPLQIPIIGDTEPPQVEITSPADGGSVKPSSNVTVHVSATDDAGVEDVEVLVGGSPVCTDTAAPYSCVWRAPTSAGARYGIEARASDAAGNVGSDHVSVRASTK